MFDLLVKGLAKLPVLEKDRRPNVAAAIGFFFGGIGLGIYFRSFIDFVLPIAISILLVVASKQLGAGLASVGWIGGAIIASLYGYYRAQYSNEARSASDGAPGAPTTVA
jgi:hypothetical protein